MARVRTPEGQLHLGSFATETEAAQAEYTYKVMNALPLTPTERTLKSWETRRLVGT